jgi:glucose-6-phosphate 1-epimerase
MAMVKELNHRFGIRNALHFDLDQHGMERAVVKTPQAEAIIYLQGAHITHYQPAGHKPVLFLSSKSNFAPGKPIRGGIPIIYPWFGAKVDDPSAPMHGFARTGMWQLEHVFDRPPNNIQLSFDLNGQLKFAVIIGRTLGISIGVPNNSSASISFEEALHTYFAVSDVRQVALHGLKGRTYIDKNDGFKRKLDNDDPLRLTGSTDRVYINSEDEVIIYDPQWARRISIKKEKSVAAHSATTVVWSPWKEMSDLPDHEWPRMLCVETANAADNAITLTPGHFHTMTAYVAVESL